MQAPGASLMRDSRRALSWAIVANGRACGANVLAGYVKPDVAATLVDVT